MGARPSITAVRSLGQSVRGWLAGASDAVVSVFFPAGCRICDSFLTHATRVPICDECLKSFENPPGRKCDTCGQILAGFGAEEGQTTQCQPCQMKTYAFARARSFGVYEGALVRAILLLKWERMEPLGAWSASRLAELVGREKETFQADVVVPVPLHRDRQRERGYNQAALLSKPLARKLRLPHQELLLMRTKPRPEKQILSLQERWDSVRGAFATRPGTQVDNQRVLLVDDVMTTGATLDACARALLEGGAKSVLGLTVARAAKSVLPSPQGGQARPNHGRKPGQVG